MNSFIKIIIWYLIFSKISKLIKIIIIIEKNLKKLIKKKI